MLTDEDIERAWLGDQTVAPRGGRITGFSRLASFARAIESAVRAEYADVPPAIDDLAANLAMAVTVTFC